MPGQKLASAYEKPQTYNALPGAAYEGLALTATTAVIRSNTSDPAASCHQETALLPPCHDARYRSLQ